MRVCGKNVFNELEPSKIRKVLLSTNFKDQEIIKKIKDNIYMILLLGTCYFCLLNHI